MTKVIVPATASGLRPEVVPAILASGWACQVEPMVDDWSYGLLLQHLWSESGDLAIVEQDVVVGTETLDAFDACPEQWCSYAYPFANRSGALATHVGLGCTRFRRNTLIWAGDGAGRHVMDRVLTMSNGGHHAGHWCDSPEARVLRMDDLRWVPLGDVIVGDVILGVDEHPIHGEVKKYRRYTPSVVQAVLPSRAKKVRIVLGDGTEMKVTPDHWLLATPPCRMNRYQRLRRTWCRAEDLVPGRWRLPKYLEPTSEGGDWRSGYLAGLFDGEGTMEPNCGRLSFGQLPGGVLDTGLRLIEECGFSTSVRDNGHGVKVVYIGHSLSERLQFLALIRPERLVARLDASRFGAVERTSHRVSIEAIEPCGKGEIVQVQTSSGTYLAEGFVSHNCALDGHLTAVLNDLGLYPHVHEGLVEHLDPWPSHGCWGDRQGPQRFP